MRRSFGHGCETAGHKTGRRSVVNMKKIYIKEEYCIGCRLCEIHCLVQHSNSKNIIRVYKGEYPKPVPRILIEEKGCLSFALQCRHCEDAPCVSICPTQALEKSYAEGPVLIKVERCIGCKFCIAVCPFGVITLNREGKAALKCDLCVERLEEGQEPACVEACHTGALRFGEVSEEVRRTREKAAKRMVTSKKQADKIQSESGS